MNFALILFLLTALTGVIALADRVYFSARRESGSAEPWWIEYAKSFFPVLLIVFLLARFSSDLGLAPLPRSSDSLFDRSGDLARRLGYSASPADTARACPPACRPGQAR